MSILRLITWNIWFDDLQIVARTKSIVTILRQEAPHVLCLQEVTPVSLQLLRAGLNDLYDFHEVFSQEGGNYGALLLTHRELTVLIDKQVHPYLLTYMGRQLLHCRVFLPVAERTVDVFTTHLESMWQMVALRREQCEAIRKVVSAVGTQTDAVLVAGDFNFANKGDIGAEALMSSFGLSDAWVALGSPVDRQWTCDGTSNDNLRSKRQMRLDRVYNSGGIRAQELRFLGREKISVECPLLPSDHYGVAVDFVMA